MLIDKDPGFGGNNYVRRLLVNSPCRIRQPESIIERLTHRDAAHARHDRVFVIPNPRNVGRTLPKFLISTDERKQWAFEDVDSRIPILPCVAVINVPCT